MPAIDVEDVRFSFPDDWEVTKFDEWRPYRRAATFGYKACDPVALHDSTLYLIEAKDYTYPDRLKGAPLDLPDTVCHKALNTLAMLFAWSRDHCPVQVSEHSALLQAIARCHSIKVCLDIELKDGGRGAISMAKTMADLTDQIKRRTKFFADGTPIVSSHHQQGRAAWTSARRPSMRRVHRDR